MDKAELAQLLEDEGGSRPQSVNAVHLNIGMGEVGMYAAALKHTVHVDSRSATKNSSGCPR